MILRQLIEQRLAPAMDVRHPSVVQSIDGIMQILEAKLLSAAHHPLLSYANGNASPDLAAEVAAAIEKAWTDHPGTKADPVGSHALAVDVLARVPRAPDGSLMAERIEVRECGNSMCDGIHVVLFNVANRIFANGSVPNELAGAFAADILRIHHRIAQRGHAPVVAS